MGFWAKLAGAGLVAGLAGLAIKAAKNSQEEARRKACEVEWDNISEDEFEEIVENAARTIKRLTQIKVIGPVVYGSVRSQSGLTDWNFTLDFNDYGEIAGRCWLTQDNADSKIPNVLKERIQEEIRDRI